MAYGPPAMGSAQRFLQMALGQKYQGRDQVLGSIDQYVNRQLQQRAQREAARGGGSGAKIGQVAGMAAGAFIPGVGPLAGMAMGGTAGGAVGGLFDSGGSTVSPMDFMQMAQQRVSSRFYDGPDAGASYPDMSGWTAEIAGTMMPGAPPALTPNR